MLVKILILVYTIWQHIISSSLESNGGGLLYTQVDDLLLILFDQKKSMTTYKSCIKSYVDVSNGIFVLSQSQKASIVEGVGQDIDIGVYDMTANNIISSSFPIIKWWWIIVYGCRW